MASENRRERRYKAQIRLAYTEQAIQNKVDKAICEEYETLIESILKSYEERLNTYLSKLSAEMIKHIGYNQVKFKLKTIWDIPNAEIKAKLLKARNASLEEGEKVFFNGIQRIHNMINTDEVEGTFVESLTLFSNISYNPINPESLKREFENSTQVEISSYTSIVGFLSEKGLEYMEAERQAVKAERENYKQQKFNTSLAEVEDIFNNAIKSKEEQGLHSEKLTIVKSPSMEAEKNLEVEILKE